MLLPFAFDDPICADIAPVLAAERTSGGRCDWVYGGAPRPVDLPGESSASLKAAA